MGSAQTQAQGDIGDEETAHTSQAMTRSCEVIFGFWDHINGDQNPSTHTIKQVMFNSVRDATMQ